jgi:hypothetical protein
MPTVLMVENRGIVGTDLLTVVGASTSRGESSMIGQFGTGQKFSIALFLRHSLDVKLTIGKDVFEFGIDERTSQDVRGRTASIREVIMKQVGGSSRKTKPGGFDVSFGEVDWTETSMGIREVISNACDASMALQGDYKGVRIELVEDPQKFARDGYTRVWIQADSEVRKYVANLDRHFPILQKGGFDIHTTIIPKQTPDTLRVYRKGVLVGQFDEYRSLNDYNLNTLELRESRTISESSATYAIARAIKRADPAHLAPILEAIAEHRDVFEVTEINHDYMARDSWDSASDTTLADNWSKATKAAFGSKVICKNSHEAEQVERKGFDAAIVSEEIQKVLRSHNVCTLAEQVLDHFEVNGREKIELTTELKQRAVALWETLEHLGVTKDKDMPVIEGYNDVMDAGGTMLGYYDRATQRIGVNSDTFDSPLAFTQTLLEEFSHHITQSGDCTRDLQDIAFKIATLLMLKK